MPIKLKVSVIITNDQGDVLLLKEKVKKQNRPLWNFVKGTYGDSGEETIFEAAQRECREEAGVDVGLVAATGCYLTGKPEDYTIQFCFVGKIISGEPRIADEAEQKARDEQISEIRWFSRDELSLMSQDEFVSEKTFVIIHDWLGGQSWDMKVFKQGI